jgi:hypothetical protein
MVLLTSSEHLSIRVMPSVNRAVVAARPVPGASDRWPSPLRSPPPVGLARCPLRLCLAHTRTTSRCCARCPEPPYIQRLDISYYQPQSTVSIWSACGIRTPKRLRAFPSVDDRAAGPECICLEWSGSRPHQRGALGQSSQGLIGQRRPQPYLEITDFSQRRARETVRCAPQICPLFRRAQNRLRSAHRWK